MERTWSRGGKKGCSFYSLATRSAQACLFLLEDCRTYIAGLFRVPEREELVERPLDTLDPLLLPLSNISVGEGEGVNMWPVR